MLESLPRELQLDILSYLPRSDYIHLSRTCRSYSRLVRPLLFSVLNFSGTPEVHESSTRRPRFGLMKAPDRGYFDDAVHQAVELGIAPFVKTFKLSPILFVDGFWDNYKGWIEDNLKYFYADPSSDFSDSTDFSDFSDDSYIGQYDEHEVESTPKNLKALLRKEYEQIEYHERVWQDKLALQQTNFESSQTALVELIECMSNLKRVEIGIWYVDPRYISIEDFHSDHLVYPNLQPGDVDLEWLQHYWDAIVWSNLDLLAAALHFTGRHIQDLRISCFNPLEFSLTPEIRHTFTGLADLHLEFDETPFRTALSDPIRGPRALPALIKCTQPTLKRLTLNFSPGPHVRSPKHTLFNLLYEPGAHDNDQSTPMIFPRLLYLNFRHITINGPSFAKFLNAQPALQTAHFDLVTVSAPHWSWSDIASAMPSSTQSWYVRDCAHRPQGKAPTTTSLINDFNPYENPLSRSCGWEVKDPLNENDTDPYLYINSIGIRWRMRDRDPDSPPLTWRERAKGLAEEDIEDHAAFVRVGTAPIVKELSEEEKERQDREIEDNIARARDAALNDANSGTKYGNGKIATCLSEQEMQVSEAR